MSFKPSALIEAPSDLLGRLRDIDPTVDLIYLGLGKWALGSVQPNVHRTRMARKLLANFSDLPVAARRPGRYLFARMIESGFRPILICDYTDLWSGWLELDFRQRDWNYRNRRDAAFEDTMKRVDDSGDVEQKIITILDAVHGTFRDAHKWGRGFGRGVLQPGLN